MRLNKWTILTLALVLASSAFLSAQEPATEARRTERAVGNADNTIASCLAISNQEEIALAKLAITHATNPKVKQLAEALIKDHQQALAQLKPFGAESVALRVPEAPAGTQERTSPRPEVARQEQARRTDSQRTASREANGFNFLDVKRQMADKCLQSAAKQWNENRGAEGDKCFVGSQIVLHQQMLDAQEVLKQHATPELQGAIDKGIATTQNHLTQAKELMKELESANAAPRANN